MTMLITICAVLMFFSLVFSRHRWYAPSVLASGIWLVSLILYACIDHGMHPLRPEICRTITCWISIFCIASWCVQSLYIKPLFYEVKSSVLVRDIYYYISLCTLPVMLITVILVLRHSGGNPFSTLRDANVEGSHGMRTTGVFVAFWLMSYILELQACNRANIGRVILLFCINLFYAVISMGKTNFMILFMSSAIILYHRKLIKFKHLVIGFVLLLSIFVGVQYLRGSYTNSKEFVALYFTSSLGNFNSNVQAQSSENSGENTFRLFYAMKSQLDGGRTKVVNPILDFKHVEIGDFAFGSNTYTALYPFYKDFGKQGVIVFAVLLGLLFGYLFKTSEDGSSLALVLYAIFSGTIVMQIIGDTFFTLLSQNIQYVIIGLIAFMVKGQEIKV